VKVTKPDIRLRIFVALLLPHFVTKSWFQQRICTQ